MKFLRTIASFIILLLIGLAPSITSAVEFENFAGGVSNVRVTNNPATVGAIDRFHIQYKIQSFDAGNRLTAFVDTAEVNSETGKVVALDDTTTISAVEYDNGTTAGFNFILVYPFELFSIGGSTEFNHEKYRDGTYLDESETPLVDIEASVTEEINTADGSVLLGIPFDKFAFGVKLTRRTIVHTVSNFNAGSLIQESDTLLTGEVAGSFSIDGNTTFNFAEYGINIPEIIKGVDLGLSYRPAVRATMRLDGFSSNVGDNVNFASFDFEQPAKSVVGGAYFIELGEIAALQFLADVGSTLPVNTDIQGQSARNGNLFSGLIRFVLPPILDVSFGSSTEAVGNFSVVKETAAIQFPLPFIEGAVAKIGATSYKLLDEDGDTIADANIPTFSINLQFGDRANRPLIVAPKTKKITFIDRL